MGRGRILFLVRRGTRLAEQMLASCRLLATSGKLCDVGSTFCESEDKSLYEQILQAAIDVRRLNRLFMWRKKCFSC